LKAYHKIAFLLIVNLCCLLQNSFAQDTAFISKPSKHTFKAEPMRATMLAVALPGFGQIYNRKYLKVPFVYAGFAGVIYAIQFNGKEYNIWMKAYQDFTDNIPETNSYLKLIRNVDPATLFEPTTYAWYKENMLREVDYYKKYRDLSYIGIAAWYLITILDANVDASLYNYDISNDLDIKVEPVVLPLSGQAAVGISLKVTF
jgi:hypothetical protein